MTKMVIDKAALEKMTKNPVNLLVRPFKKELTYPEIQTLIVLLQLKSLYDDVGISVDFEIEEGDFFK